MNMDAIFEWILKHPINYPGQHQESQPRTNPAYKPLEPKAQFHIILKATKEYIREQMLEGKGINMKNFGAFTFEIASDTVKPAQHSNFDINQDLDEQRLERKHVHRIRPCFVPDKSFVYTLSRYVGKEELTAPKSQNSIYQKGFSMTFCNPGPIANSCYLGKDVVASSHAAFIQALNDLATLGYDIVIDWNFFKLNVTNKDMRYKFEPNFGNQLNQTSFETKMRKSDLPTSQHWMTSYEDKWNKSTLNSLLKRPEPEKVKDFYEKTLTLQIMSLDLNTATKTEYSQNATKGLPALKTSNTKLN